MIRGLTSHVDPATLTDLESLGIGLVRFDAQDADDATLDRYVEYCQTSKIRTLFILSRFDQIRRLPRGWWAEWGNEPDLEIVDGRAPWTTFDYYRESLSQATRVAAEAGVTLHAPALSNLLPGTLAFLRALMPLPDGVVCTIHRYHQRPDAQWPDPLKGYRNRTEELAALKAIIGCDRPFAVSEFGYHTGPYKRWFRTRRLSDEQAAWNIAREFDWWEQQGAVFAVLYQINDEPGPTGKPFGIRHAYGSPWKPQARVFGGAVPRPTPHLIRILRAHVSVYHPDGTPIRTARGTLTVDAVERMPEEVVRSSGWRQTFAMVEGPGARPGWGAWLRVHADGYLSHVSRVYLPDGDGELATVVMQPMAPPVDLRKWRGDFLGDFVQPALMYGGMPAALRAEALAEYRAKHYTHLPIAVHNDYPRFPQWAWDWWNQPEQMRACCQEIRSAGIEPIMVLHPKSGWTIDDHLAHVRALWPHIHAITRMVTWGWEINDLGGEWGNGDQLLHYLDGLQAIVGQVPIGVHFTPERWSGWPSFDGSDDTKSEYDWLKEAKRRGATALLYQESPDKPEDEVIDRAFLLETPFPSSPGRKGIAGRVVDACGVDFVLFEFSRDVGRHDRLAARAMTFPTCSGFC